MLTPLRVAAMYEMLRTYPPFKHKLFPHADEVEFSVADWKEQSGAFKPACIRPEGTHKIAISATKNGHLTSVLMTLAHEMLHLDQEVRGTDTDSDDHNPEFKKLAHRLCRRFGWDEKTF
jgi:hypothetical protein